MSEYQLMIECTGCEKCGAELDKWAGDDVEGGICPDCRRQMKAINMINYGCEDPDDTL